MYFVYSLLILVFGIVASPYLAYQAIRYKKYISSLSQRMGYLPVSFNLDGEESIWIHAVSVGEVLTARALIVGAVPGVRKAVKWNTPFYGIEGEGWFVAFHCITKYVKVAFFRGASLRPVPPGESKSKDTRYLDIHEDDPFDEAQLAAWVKQASQLPAERM